jgi:predicted permease
MAVRSLRRSPFFAAAVVLILALGISANVTIFRVLDRLLLSPPERIESPDEVKRLSVYGKNLFSGQVGHTSALSYPDYLGLKGVSGFDATAGASKRTLTLSVDDASEPVEVQLATASYFELLGVRPAVGRFYVEAEDVVSPESRTAVLSWSYWRERFGGDRGVLGRDVDIGRASYTVIGVAPRGFTGVDISPVDVWLPLHAALAAESNTSDWLTAHGWLVMGAIARVAGGEAPAAEEASVALRRVRESGNRADPEMRVVLAPLISARGPNPSRESQVARMLPLLTVLVLLITCANAGNLYLARVIGRRRELAVQGALGVTRGRLFGQLIVEVLIVALAASVLAWWIGTLAARPLFAVLLPDATLPTTDGPRVLTITVALALVTALLTGVLPALRASRVSVMDALRRGTATRRTLLVRRGLLALQAALSVVLLVGAGLFVRSLMTARSVDFGLDTSTLTVDVELLGGTTFGEEMGDEVLRLLPLLRQGALVESAAAASIAPLSGWWGVGVTSPDGEAIESGADGPFIYGVTGDYFASLDLPIVRGRALTDADAQPNAQPVAVVNETMAARLWPGREAIGRCLLSSRGDDSQPCTTVVGVAGDYARSIGDPTAPALWYVPPTHSALGSTAANTMIVRPRADATRGMIRDYVRAIAPHLRMVTVAPLSDRFANELRAWQLGAALLTAVGILALVIAAAGLYSMLTFDVMQRRRELGIRAALGASAGDLVRATVATSVVAVTVGVAIGLLASLAGGRVIESLLFQVSARDPVVYAGVCLVLLATGVIAGLLPARTVTRTDPAVPLREE